MDLSRLFNPKYAQASKERDLDFQAWRERILRSFYITGIVGGIFALVTTVPVAINQGKYVSAASYIFIYLMVILITIYPRIPYLLRAGFAIIIFYALGLVTIQTLGLMGNGRLWLFSFSILTTVLLGWKYGLATLFINLATTIIFGSLLARGLIDWSLSEGHTIEIWTSTSVAFVLIITMMTGFVGFIVSGLEKTLINEKKLSRELEKEHAFLERRVLERTQELDHKARELARSNNELQNFAHIASHDLQEPLRMISSYLQLLERRYKGQLDDEADEFIHYSVDGAQRMGALLDGLLSYARVDSKGGDFVIVDTHHCVQKALTNLKVALDEQQAVVNIGDLPSLEADPMQLVQLFQNLIGNALKYRRELQPEIHISASREASDWIFSIRDNGIGFDEEQAGRIFMIFQRLHNKDDVDGLGLGLAICKKIVERHEGRIWAESNPGEGSCFYFTLPAEETLEAGRSNTLPANLVRLRRGIEIT